MLKKVPLHICSHYSYSNVIATTPVLTNGVGNTFYYALKRQLCLPGKDLPIPYSKKVRTLY